MSALVQLDDVFRVYPSPEGGVAALQGLSLAVEQGELCVVLGPSGSGKSTLLRIVAGFDRASAGSVRVAGVDVGALGGWAAARFRSRSIGYADQHYWRALAGELTARELVGIQLGLAGAPPAERHARADELLERVGLGSRRDAHPRELSGGEQQRVALCAALAISPALLIADEPTGELDAATARDVLALIADLVRESGGTALVVSHDPASAERADRVIHVRDGRISDERVAGASGDGAIVVGRGGWLRASRGRAPLGRNRPPCDGRAPRPRGRPRTDGSLVFLKHKLLPPHATKPFQSRRRAQVFLKHKVSRPSFRSGG